MKRFQSLDAVLEHIRIYLHDAVDDRQKAFTTPVVATDGPAARTVALRDVNIDDRTLLFHTDVRSAKIDELRDTPSAMWVAWEPEISQQFQFSGSTSIHTDGDIADRVWQLQSTDNRAFYYKDAVPGEPIDRPASCIDVDAISDDEARSNFAVVRTVIDQITWLHLHPDGEYRARFHWDGDRFTGDWIVP